MSEGVPMKLSRLLHRLPAWVLNGITVTLGLALVQCSIGFIAGAQAAQTAIATAVCASLADVVATTDRVARRVLVAGIASTLSGALFLLVRPYHGLLIPTVALIVFGAMLLLSWGPKAGSVSFAASLALVFAMSLPDSQPLTWTRFGWGLVGSVGYWIWAVVTARLLQPSWRHFALASTAEGEAHLLAAIARQIQQPDQVVWQSGVLDAETALADRLQNARDLVFANDRGPDARRETALLLHLIDLRDLAMAINLESSQFPNQPVTQRQAELTAHVTQGIADALSVIATSLQGGATPELDALLEPSLHALLAELEQSTTADRCAAVLEVNSLLRAQLELLRSIERLLHADAEVRLSCQRIDLRRYISPDEWRLTSVAANLRPGSPVFRHALRTSVTAGFAYTLSRFSPWTPHPQWIILTIAAVMQGSLAQTLLRRNARVLGTLAGCLVVVALTLYPSPLFLASSFLVASGVAHAFFGVRYSVTAGAAAVMAVLQAHLAVPASGFSTLERVADTVAGALLGWAATYVLPTWERNTLPSVLQQAVTAMRAYAAEATGLHDTSTGAPRFARQRAYDALRALSVIRSRSLAEPETVRVPIPALTAWLTAAYGVMSHLSNLRLTLTLHARDCESAELAAAMATVSRTLDGLFDAGANAALLSPTLSPENERVLKVIPHLASRVRRTLEAASRISIQLALLEAPAPV
ncbi:MAG: FUSC family protein [Paucibacter sp.]|nr:FUSC family protein [Roseateles sp.]